MEMLAKYGSQREVARQCGVSQKTVWYWLNLGGASGDGARDANGAGREPKKTVTEFRQLYDKSHMVPAAIRAALSKLGNHWEYEVSFARMAGISMMDLGRYRDLFSEHVIDVRGGRRVWAGTRSLATELRNMV